jgi:hypothetical protein
VWATRFLHLLDVRRDQAIDVAVHSEPHDSALLVHQWPTSMAHNVATAVCPNEPFSKAEEAAWRRGQTSGKPLRAFRLARAVKIEHPDILQTTSGFNCAVCYMHPVQTMQFTKNESWLLVHAVWSLKFPHSRGPHGIATRRLFDLARPTRQVVELKKCSVPVPSVNVRGSVWQTDRGAFVSLL